MDNKSEISLVAELALHQQGHDFARADRQANLAQLFFALVHVVDFDFDTQFAAQTHEESCRLGREAENLRGLVKMTRVIEISRALTCPVPHSMFHTTVKFLT